MNYCEQIIKYCNDVIADVLPNRKTCQLEKLSCLRHLNDLAKQDDEDYPFYFDEEACNSRCFFTECLQHTKGKWRGQNIKLEPHQMFKQGVLFGWKKKSTGTRRFTKAYIEEPRKNGKALEINTPVFTTKGWKNHGDLKPGDFVFSPEGKPIKVLAVSEHYEGNCYELGFSDGEFIIAHEYHEWVTNRTWYTKRAKGERSQFELPPVESWEIANTLKMSGVRKDFVHTVDINKPLQLEEKDLIISPYVLGLWLGDGNTLSARITTMDEEIVNNVKKLGYVFEKLDYVKGQGLAKTYTLNDKERLFSKALRAFGLIGFKHIPEEYFLSSIEQRYELLRGILDTDGYISKAGQISLGLSNYELIKDCEKLIKSLGIKTNLKEKMAKCNGKNCGVTYLLHFFPKDNTPLFKLTRKLERQKPIIENGKRKRSCTKTIISAEEVGEYFVNCITVEGSLYLAGENFTITHNSIDAATTGLFMAFVDGEQGAEVYAGATTEAQAMCVFEPAHTMARLNPQMAEYFDLKLTGTPKNPTSIYRESDMSKFMPVIGKPGDGASPHCALVDEYHEHPTSVLYDAMDTGMGARDQPLLLVITTAGISTAVPCYDLHCEAVKVLEGTVENDSLFCMIFTIDKEDSWEDFENWKKANPNYSVSINEDYLFTKFQEALNKPAQRNILLTKHLNIWQNAGIAFVDALKWREAGDETLCLEMFKGQECWLALDLASKIDLCALVLLFKHKKRIINANCPKCFGEVQVVNGMNVCVSNRLLEDETKCDWKKPIEREGVVAFAKHYLPEATIEKRENQHYQKWFLEGWLTKTEGERTDFGVVEEDIKQISEDFIIKELAFDQKEATHIIHLISQWSNFECVEFPQSPALINEPMKELEAMIAANEFWHNNNPIFTWCMGNIIKKQSRSGGATKTYFPTKENDKLKIDSGVAAIMALGRLKVAEDDGDSYNARAKRGDDEILRVL